MKKIKILVFVIVSMLLLQSVSAERFIRKDKWSKFAKTYNYDENYKTSKPKAENKPKVAPAASAPMFSGHQEIAITLIIIVAVVLIGAIVMLIIDINKSPVNISVQEYNPNITGTNYENIENADLENDLKKALSTNNYKEAIRINYLIILRLLNKQNLIVWKKEKTNGKYLREMMDKKEFNSFRNITIYFERIWYGEFTISENEYHKMVPVFEQMQTLIHSRE